MIWRERVFTRGSATVVLTQALYDHGHGSELSSLSGSKSFLEHTCPLEVQSNEEK